MKLEEKLKKHAEEFSSVIPFDPEKDHFYLFEFTNRNRELSSEQIADTEQFGSYIQSKLVQHHCKYGIGGYNEHRTLYARSKHFSAPMRSPERKAASADTIEEEQPRRLHLGTDIWGPAGTWVMSPLDAIVHSFAFNNNDSDYGATIILTHNIEGIGFHTLYGHLSLNSIKNLHSGKRIRKGEVFTEFGMRFENGNWPPHLHFQIIKDLQGWEGDYPGVCIYEERANWLNNCPDPDLILSLNRFISV
ncbi:MAG TPA: peptidoglycan DD-metalloendopeptidase family protein [Puia sp.]|nr:peptidoglycan DD-metalloendopeptidase family protein [Puia sp.]